MTRPWSSRMGSRSGGAVAPGSSAASSSSRVSDKVYGWVISFGTVGPRDFHSVSSCAALRSKLKQNLAVREFARSGSNSKHGGSSSSSWRMGYRRSPRKRDPGDRDPRPLHARFHCHDYNILILWVLLGLRL